MSIYHFTTIQNSFSSVKQIIDVIIHLWTAVCQYSDMSSSWLTTNDSEKEGYQFQLLCARLGE